MVSLKYTLGGVWIISKSWLSITCMAHFYQYKEPGSPGSRAQPGARLSDTNLPPKVAIIYERERHKATTQRELGASRHNESGSSKVDTESAKKASVIITSGFSDTDSKPQSLRSERDTLMMNVQNMEAQLASDIQHYRAGRKDIEHLLQSLRRANRECRIRDERRPEELSKCRMSFIADEKAQIELQQDLSAIEAGIQIQKMSLLNREKAIRSRMDEVLERQTELEVREEAVARREREILRQGSSRNPCVVQLVTCGKRARRFP